jgi:alkyl hydroperoxide reductase subunit AhpC
LEALRAHDRRPVPSVRTDGLRFDDPAAPFATIDSGSAVGHRRVFFFFFFWPKDFTCVCPTELSAFADLHEEFVRRDARGSRRLS